MLVRKLVSLQDRRSKIPIAFLLKTSRTYELMSSKAYELISLIVLPVFFFESVAERCIFGIGCNATQIDQRLKYRLAASEI